jgi:lysozyme
MPDTLSAIPHFPAGIWPTHTVWQFSFERKTHITVPGVKSDMDISVAHGTQAEFRQRWPLT